MSNKLKILNLTRPWMKKILDDNDLLVKSYNYPILNFYRWNNLQDYKKIWYVHYKNKSYHFRLIDQSLLRFLFMEDRLSFEYIHCPYKIKKNFVIDEFSDEEFLRDEELIEIIPTPIRYDYNPETFSPISHPIGHIHIGLQNSIRIATNFILNPISFLLFCLRQMYSDYWNIILNYKNYARYKKHIRDKIRSIDKKNQVAFDHEHYLF